MDECPGSITASIVLYKPDRVALSRVLESFSNSQSISVTVCVVDNSPSEQLRAIVEGYGFLYLSRPNNPGFGASHNHAFAKIACNSEYHFIANPDIRFKANDLATLISYMRGNSDVSLVVPKLTYPDGRMQYNRWLLPSPKNLFLRRFLGNTDFAKKADHQYELQFADDSKAMEAPSLAGSFMLVRSSMFRKINGFDEQFFMYMEDFDLTRRIGRCGKTVYCPSTTIVHEGPRGSYKTGKLLFLHIISAIKYFNKWGWFFDGERDAINRKTVSTLIAPQ